MLGQKRESRRHDDVGSLRVRVMAGIRHDLTVVAESIDPGGLRHWVSEVGVTVADEGTQRRSDLCQPCLRDRVIQLHGELAEGTKAAGLAQIGADVAEVLAEPGRRGAREQVLAGDDVAVGAEGGVARAVSLLRKLGNWGLVF